MLRGGIYSVINIGGLAIGMAAAITILLWVYHHWSYDRFHDKDKHLYKVWCYNEANGNFANVSMSIGPNLVEEYAGFAGMSRYGEYEIPFEISREKSPVAGSFNKMRVATVDTGFLNMFSFPLLRGDASTAFVDPYSIVITQSISRRWFGDDDPMGETFLMNGTLNFKVTGILADLPANTGFGFDVLIPVNRFGFDNSWGNPSAVNTCTFIELAPEVNVQAISASIRDIIAKHTGGSVDTKTYLQHISEWHLYNRFEQGVSVGGRIEMMRMFGLIAGLILLIACVNFMNLRTAQSTKYAREVGVRKVIGARSTSLILCFLGESIFIAAISGLCALYIVLVCLPFFNAIVGENLSINLRNGVFWIMWMLFVLITGVLAGSYPSFYLSSFLPVKVLKGVFKTGNGWVTPRRALIVAQFTFAGCNANLMLF